MRRVLLILSVLSMMLAAAPLVASAGPPASVWPGADGSPSHTRRSPDSGPTNPGVAWETPLSAIDAGPGVTVLGVNGANESHGYEIIDDGGGHVVAHVGLDDDGPDNPESALLALDQGDGGVAWLTDPAELEIERTCPPWVDSTGALWAMASRSDEMGTVIPSVLPVEIDPADGTVVARPLDDVPDEDLPDTRAGDCAFPPTLTPDDILVFQMRVHGQPLVAIDLIDGTLVWSVDLAAAGYRADADWVVPSADGSQILVGLDTEETGDQELTVLALDAADGSIIDQTTVTGRDYYTVIHENPVMGLPDGGVVFGTNLGSQNGRLIRLHPDLGVAWDVPTQTGGAAPGDLRPLGTLALGGAAGDLVLGWSVSTPDDVYAVSLDDGTLVWQANPVGSRSGQSITVDSEGYAYLGVLGNNDAARVQVLEPDGSLGNTVTGAALSDVSLGNKNVRGMGPVIDARLFVAVDREADTAFIAFDNSGGPPEPTDPPTEPTDPPSETVIPAGVSRPAGDSDDPRQVAIDMCQFLNPGVDSTRAVILAQDEIFADALTGSPLAGDDGCVLFTGRAPEPLDPRTAVEIDRALADGGTVYLLGGEAAVPGSVESTLVTNGYDVQRLAGPGRIQTAIAIAQEVQLLNPPNTTVMLAYEGNWPDAVAGGAYGAEAGVPILLTRTDELPFDTLSTMTSMEYDEVILLGSNVVISDEVEDGLWQPTIRAGGVNRMATATEIAAQLWQGRSGLNEDRFLMVNLEAPNAWTLALAAAPLSARVDAPQLGIGNTRYPTETSDYLDSRGFDELPSVGLVGGLAFIGEDIEAEIDAALGGG